MADLDDEAQLIERCRQNDHEAFAVMVGRYQRMIHSLAYRMTGSLADADDLAQEAFLRAFRQIAAFRGDARFSSWLSRIAINTALNWKNRAERRAALHEEWAASREPGADREDERSRHIQEALLKLHPKQRAAITLTVYEGMNHAEAARVLGCSETTVSWRIFAARRKLKRLLTHYLTPGAAGPQPKACGSHG